MKQSMLFISLSLLLIAGMTFGTVAAEPDMFASAKVVPLDFSTWVSNGGEWTVTGTGAEAEIKQATADGNAYFSSQDINLPENYSFEADFGCIFGNLPDVRPFFGIYFNSSGRYSFDEVKDYYFRYRPSSAIWELSSHGVKDFDTQKAPLTGEYTSWDWDLKEWHNLKIVRMGERIECYVDGEQVLAVDGAKLTGGGIEFITISTAAVMKNVVYKTLD
jgi:hypothetical protein